jgi:hypothetical protein
MPLLAQPRINSVPRRLRAGLVGGLAAALVTSTSADAAGLIRDAETESLVRLYAKPIFNAAGLGSQGIRIHIVNDKNFNAFVVDGHNMFMHAGTLMTAKTPNEVIGVIAHESGHITGGHLARLRTQVSRAQSAALMLQLLGLAAMVGGAFAGSPGIGQAGMGVAYGGQDAALRSLLAYRQDEESSADQAAMTFLNATKQSACRRRACVLGAVDRRAQLIPTCKAILPAQRIVHLASLSPEPYYENVDPPELQFRHDLMKANLRLPRRAEMFFPLPEEIRACRQRRERPRPIASPAKWQSQRSMPDRRQARLAVFLRDQGSVPVRKRQAGRRDPPAPRGGETQSRRAADPHHAGSGNARRQRSKARG